MRPHRQAPWPYRGGQTGLGTPFTLPLRTISPPKTQRMRMPYTTHTCVDPNLSEVTSRPRPWKHTPPALQGFCNPPIHTIFASHRQSSHQSLTRTRPSHGMAWTESDPNTTAHPTLVVSVSHYNGTTPQYLRRSMLRAVTFDARFSVYRTPKTEEKATAPGYPHRLASKTLGHRTGLATSPKHVSFAGDGSLPPCECSPRATTGL
jgi:hypothetical protein